MIFNFLTDILMSSNSITHRTNEASIWTLRQDVESSNFSAKSIETLVSLEGTNSIIYEEPWIKFCGAKMPYLLSFVGTGLGCVRAHGDNCHNIGSIRCDE